MTTILGRTLETLLSSALRRGARIRPVGTINGEDVMETIIGGASLIGIIDGGPRSGTVIIDSTKRRIINGTAGPRAGMRLKTIPAGTMNGPSGAGTMPIGRLQRLTSMPMSQQAAMIRGGRLGARSQRKMLKSTTPMRIHSAAYLRRPPHPSLQTTLGTLGTAKPHRVLITPKPPGAAGGQFRRHLRRQIRLPSPEPPRASLRRHLHRQIRLPSPEPPRASRRRLRRHLWRHPLEKLDW
jgi:hypothetical protein